MDRADRELPRLEQLRDTQALRTGEAKIHALGDAALEQCQVLGAGDARDQQVQLAHPGRIDLGERAREEIRLFLVIALEHHAVTGAQQRLEQRHDLLRANVFALRVTRGSFQASQLLLATRGPRDRCWANFG